MLSDRTTVRGTVIAVGGAVATAALSIGVTAAAADEPAASAAPPAQVDAGHVLMGKREADRQRLYEVRQADRKRAAEKARSARAKARASRAAGRVATYNTAPRDVAADMAASRYGWGASQFDCLDQLWTAESGWDTNAQNPSSGAYGIPQALPGSKMAAYGSDWETNAATQIEWGLAYVSESYGTPCSAWQTFQSRGWY